jgi:hypothetical protein
MILIDSFRLFAINYPMKVAPITGKAYFKEWQRDLDRIHHTGFSYGYVEIVDLATGEHSWQVDAMKGGGPQVVVEMSTIKEAVGELGRMLLRAVKMLYGKRIMRIIMNNYLRLSLTAALRSAT